jgi:phosphoribosylformylglycinamidine cyclo-ligase
MEKCHNREDVRPKDSIIGVSSGGQAKYETKPAGWMMSNGYTLARHCLISSEIAEKYPEIGKKYWGPYSPTDKVDGIDGTISEEITRPTRVFAPVFKGVLENFRGAVHGIVFNTGGGHTKCLRIGKKIMYVKDDLPGLPMIFRLVQEHGKVQWEEMYQAFNMGIGAEIYADRSAESEISAFVRDEFGIEASRIGKCQRSRGRNEVRLETVHGNFDYPKKKK